MPKLLRSFLKFTIISLAVFCSLSSIGQINTNIITADASGCTGMTNYSGGEENHRIYYYPGSATSTSQTPATLTASSPSGNPMTFVWMKFVIVLDDAANDPKNGWKQVGTDANVTTSVLPNQGIGAYLVYTYDAAGVFAGYDLIWVLVTRLQPTQVPSANITNNTTDCDGPNTINGTTTGTSNGLILAPANTPYSYSVPPPLPLIINSNSTISINFQGTQPNTLAPLVFAIEGPSSCDNPIVYLGSVPGFSPASGTAPATGAFNPGGCNNGTPVNFDLSFTNVPGTVYSACGITTGADPSTGSYYAIPPASAIPTPQSFDFSPLYGCDATN
ncbi:MAG: hypothetical protein ACKOW8_10540, partial [Flavobacteriales bacterium]